LHACPKLVPGFPTKYGIFVFSELRWDMSIRFVDINGIVDHHSLNYSCVAKTTIKQCTTDVNSTEANNLT
jgi:hypothetical protein